MKKAAIGMVALLMVAGGLSTAYGISVRNGGIFTGEIMDSFCAGDGHHIGVVRSDKNTSKAGCTLTCVKLGGAQFVLYDSRTKSVYKLDDQRQPEGFAGQKVVVTGTYDEAAKTIHVVAVRPVIIDATLRSR